jgi:hypothetical protein
MTDQAHIKQLTGAVAGLSGEAEYAAAQGAVLLCAVAALVRTHPAPEVFAAEFRRTWLAIGHPHTNESLVGAGAAESHTAQGLSEALAVLEEACAAPLNVRPAGATQRLGGAA